MQKKKRTLTISNELEWQNALEDFLLFKKAEGRSERTIQDYSYHVKAFFNHNDGVKLSDAKSLRECALEFMAQTAKPAYYNNKLVYLKTFFNWCLSEGIISENPVGDMKRVKADERISELSVITIKKLLQLPNQKTFPGLRDYALILLQLDTGIRPKEALSLLICDVNLSSFEVYVRAHNAKTRIARTLPVSAYTMSAIKKVIHVRPSYWSSSAPVFCTCEGKK